MSANKKNQGVLVFEHEEYLGSAAGQMKIDSYGGIVVSGGDKVLLREAANHFAGYVWTFAKTLTHRGETPHETAARAVLEKTGYKAEVRASIPGIFKGSASTTGYYLMDASHPPAPHNSHTSGLRWASFDDARELIRKTTNIEGRERDLALLDAVQRVVKQIPYSEHMNVQPEDFWEPLGIIGDRRAVLHPKLHFTAEEMTCIQRGFFPTVMEQKWFIYYTDGRLRLHRSWTGLLYFDIGFIVHDDRSTTISEVIINRDVHESVSPDADAEDLQLMQDVIRYHLLEPLDAPVVDGFVMALSQALQPNYLGSPDVVSKLVQDVFDMIIRRISNEADDDDVSQAISKVADAMANESSEYTRMDGWHSTAQLGAHINKYLLDGKGVGELHLLVCQGLSAMTMQILHMLKEFMQDPAATWERHALPQLNELQSFVVAVLLGTNSVLHDGRLLGDFDWNPASSV